MKIIVNSVNSRIGKFGSIGYRAFKVLVYVNGFSNVKQFCMCREFDSKLNIESVTLGVRNFITKLLNFYRIYFNNRFNFRKYDIQCFDFFTLKSLKKINHKNKSNQQLLHIWEPCINSIRFAKSIGYKVVLDIPIAPSMHSLHLDELGLLGPHKHNLDELIAKEKKCFELVDHFIVPSEFVSNILSKYEIPPSNISIVNFGVDYKKFQFNRKYCSGSLKFCFAGAINRRKGIKFLLEAFDDPVFENDELHLCGRLFKEQRELIQKRNLSNLILPGIINTADYFRKCDVYVFPSLMEGSSKSIFEAMASGMPVVTTNYSGSIVRDGCEGFIVPAGNPDILRQKMIDVKNNLLLRKKMGEASQSLVSQYTWECYARGVVEVYKELLHT